MSIYAAYALMLLVPVLLPVVVIGFGVLLASIHIDTWPLGVVSFALLAVIGFAGMPYLVMSVGLVFWARDRSPAAIRSAANLAPLILWLLVLLWWSSTWLNRGPEDLPLPRWGRLELFGWISVLVLGPGYVWVMLAHGLVRWLRKQKFVADTA